MKNASGRRPKKLRAVEDGVLTSEGVSLSVPTSREAAC